MLELGILVKKDFVGFWILQLLRTNLSSSTYIFFRHYSKMNSTLFLDMTDIILRNLCLLGQLLYIAQALYIYNPPIRTLSSLLILGIFNL